MDSNNLQDVLQRVVAGETLGESDRLTLRLTVSDEDDSAPGAEEIKQIARGRALQFFDITATKQINENTPIALPELPTPAQVIIDLSSEMSGKMGYSVYRWHGGNVEYLGEQSADGEPYTVSRGTGAGGVDQIIIYAKKFSTYAVVEHIISLGEGDTEGFDVPVDMEVYTENIHTTKTAPVEASGLGIAMVPYHGAAQNEAEYVDAYLWINGMPVEPESMPHDPETFHKAGIITVTIIPDAESERRTPR